MNVVPYDPLDLVEGMMKSVLRPSFESAFRGRNGLQGRTIPVDHHLTAVMPFQRGRPGRFSGVAGVPDRALLRPFFSFLTLGLLHALVDIGSPAPA